MNDPLLQSTDLQRVEAVVVGASAGGVEALMTVFGALTARFSLPIVSVLHMPDGHRSQLAEVFGRRLALPVKEADDKESIVPGTLYFAAPGYHLSIEQDRSFSFSREERVHYSRPSIDYLFAHQARTVSVRRRGKEIIDRGPGIVHPLFATERKAAVLLDGQVIPGSGEVQGARHNA